MKTKLFTKPVAICCLLFAISGMAFAQGTAFTYQGLLTDNGAPANGAYDLTFTLYDAVSGGATVGTSNVVNDLAISNGLYTVTLDYGAAAFPGANRWLQIAVRPGASTGAYTNVTPRQQITSTPYAIRAANFSGTVSNSQFSGTYTNAVTISNSASVFAGSFKGNGTGLTNVNAATVGGMPAAEFWQLDGNNVSLGQILGSTNNQVVQLVVNGFNALRLEPNTMASPNVIGGNGSTVAAGVYGATIGGGLNNSIQSNSVEAVIAGGGLNHIESDAFDSAISGGSNNRIKVGSSTSTIAGGESNTIETNSDHSFLGGGLQNDLQGNTGFSTVVGGSVNIIQFGANYSTIGGGKNNTNGATTSVIVGGEGNTVQAGADRSFIGGGLRNITTGALGMVPGGFANSAAGQAFAAGRRAKANHTGAFVWADSTDADFASTAQNQVLMRAAGGYFLYSNGAGTLGVTLAPNGISWGTLSDRNAKKNFAPVDSRDILEKLAGLSVQRWNYRWETDDAIPNLGPMAQDFKAAFYPGRDDKIITTLEFDGVELAAIQGLNQKVKEKDSEIQTLKRQNETLEKRLDNLEQMVKSISGKN